jgi:hypothetical protein
MHIFERSLHYRYYANLETTWWDVYKLKELKAYMDILLEEFSTISNSSTETHPEIFRDNHLLFYTTTYN